MNKFPRPRLPFNARLKRQLRLISINIRFMSFQIRPQWIFLIWIPWFVNLIDPFLILIVLQDRQVCHVRLTMIDDQDTANCFGRGRQPLPLPNPKFNNKFTQFNNQNEQSALFIFTRRQQFRHSFQQEFDNFIKLIKVISGSSKDVAILNKQNRIKGFFDSSSWIDPNCSLTSHYNVWTSSTTRTLMEINKENEI